MAITPEVDWSTAKPVKPDIDWTTAQSSDAPAQKSPITPEVAPDAWKAGVYSRMLGVEPGFAYQNRDEIDKQLRETGGDDYDKGIGYAIKTGFEETPLGLIIRGQAPEPFESHSHIGNFIHDVSEMVSDPIMLASAFTSEVGVGVGGFAADAALRKLLMDQYTKGDVKSFGDLAGRAGGILWEGAKGGILAKAGMVAGEIPVGSLIAKSPMAASAMKGLYQSAVMTTAGSLLDGRLPQVSDFERSAALIVPLNLVSGGAFLRARPAKQALMDAYSKTGTPPAEAAEKLDVQPHVPEDLAPGLGPAIDYKGAVAKGNEGDVHDDIHERLTNKPPVSLERLTADPKLADDVLSNPAPHGQDVIDRAWQLKKEAMDNGERQEGDPDAIEDMYDHGTMKSGRGFVTPDGKFLDRTAARRWSKTNEPAVHDMWATVAGGDKEELHSEDYNTARERVSGRNVAVGEPTLKPDQGLSGFLANARKELNGIKASAAKMSRYGKSVLRTLFVGPRDMLRAQSAQTADHVRTLLPDFRDQEALSFARDYKGVPDQLAKKIEDVRKGSNEELKKTIPSMERALAQMQNPTPEFQQADGMLTDYFTRAISLRRQVGISDSRIDPERYSPRLFMRAGEERPGYSMDIRREYEHILDPLESGEVEARTFNSADQLGVYGNKHATSVAKALFKTEIKNSELGKYGTRKSVPQNWVELSPSDKGFSQTMTKIDPETSETVTWSRGLYVPKPVADAMEPIFKDSRVPELHGVLRAQNYVKAIELSLSIFHMKSLTISAGNNMSFGDFARALKSDNASPEFEAMEQEAALWGLQTTKTGIAYEAYKGLKPSSLPTGLDTLRNLPVLKQVDAFAQSLTHETFDVIQRKFKVMDYSQKAAKWMAENPNAKEAQYGSAMRGISKEVNAVYGNLNWDVLGVSRGVRDISRMFILAPDWTFSNLANLKYVGEGGPAGAAARMFWVKSFTTGIAMTAAASQLIGGKYDWTHPFSVYLGQDKDGQPMYSNMFFAGAPKDAITLVNRVMKDGLLEGIVGFAANKFGPIASTARGLAENKQRTGLPISKPTDTPADKNVKQAKYAAGELLPVPFGLKEIGQQLTDPKQEASKWDYFLPLIGNYVTHERQAAGGSGGESKEKPILPGQSKGKSGGFHLPGL
jgi:hypothetical protein